MILCAARTSSMKIDVIDFDKALDLLRRTEKMMPYTFSGLGKSTTSDSLNRMLSLVGMRKRISVAELQAQFYNDADAKTLEGMIATMNLMDYAKTVHEGSESFIIYNENQTVRVLP